MTSEQPSASAASARRPGGPLSAWLCFGARLILAVVFVCAAVPKALAVDAFVVTVDSYELLSVWPTVCLAASWIRSFFLPRRGMRISTFFPPRLVFNHCLMMFDSSIS